MKKLYFLTVLIPLLLSPACSQSSDDVDVKIEELMKMITANPNDAVAHNNLAVTYYDKQQYKLAIQHCDKARELGYRINPSFLKALEPYR